MNKYQIVVFFVAVAMCVGLLSVAYLLLGELKG